MSDSRVMVGFRSVGDRNRRWPDVMAYSDRFDRFDTACHSDGEGARKIAQGLVLDRLPGRAIGASGAPNSGRSKASRAGKLAHSPDPESTTPPKRSMIAWRRWFGHRGP